MVEGGQTVVHGEEDDGRSVGSKEVMADGRERFFLRMVRKPLGRTILYT